MADAMDTQPSKLRGLKRKFAQAHLAVEQELDPPAAKRVKREPSAAEKAHQKNINLKAARYARGKQVRYSKIQDKKLRSSMKHTEKQAKMAREYAARAEILQTTEPGFLEPEGGLDATYKVKQSEIKEAVGAIAANKSFELTLEEYGPYRLDYARNGRFMLLGGAKGHVSLIDVMRSKALCELKLKENVYDVQILHNETLFAVAQKKYVYVYDKQGTELHCLKSHQHALRLEFLPYHFLLASVGRQGLLRYQDTSTGQFVTEYRTKLGLCDVMAQNPRNAIIHLGHQNGVVTMWSPNSGNPLVKMLTHRGPVKDVVVDPTGHQMATAGADSRVCIWDLRTYQVLQSYTNSRTIEHLDYSQTGLLSVSYNNHVQVWKDFATQRMTTPYMVYDLPQGGSIQDVRFCPFEDVLGIGHDGGFSSILIPGAGVANFDTFEANPFETKKQRRETTVVRLLEKIQPDMINLDANFIGMVTDSTKKEHIEDQKAALAGDTPGRQWAMEKKEKKKARGGDAGGKKEAKKQTKAFEQKREAKKQANVSKLLDAQKQTGRASTESLQEFETTLDRFK